MPSIVNIAAYRFTALDHLEERRSTLLSTAEEVGLLGTILLSEEGINLVLAGRRGAVDRILDAVRAFPGCEDIDVKESYSDVQPFGKMRVKVKREIIAFGVPEVDPRSAESRRLSAADLKAWLDEGREFCLLDTRNEFEIDAGTFVGAVPVGVDNFRDFPEAAAALPETLRDVPVVTFCTGGIRCEKAGPYLEQAGFKDVYQLDGGILKYFEEVGGEHFEGNCFVFDDRIALDPKLEPAEFDEPPRLF